jgi:YVTN family beta-propeller protein
MGRSSISVRGLAVVAVVCALFCLAAASASGAPLVWVPNSEPGHDSVFSIDSATGKEVGKPIPVAQDPGSIAITPDGRRAVVAESNGESAQVIDTASRKPFKPIPLGGSGQQVAISPDGKVAYVTNEPSEEVHVIDTETGTLRGGIDVGAFTWAVAFSPDGRYAYVGTRSHEIITIDTETEKVVGPAIKVGGTPESIAFTPDGKTAYVVVEKVSSVVVVDTTLGQVVGEIPMPEASDSVAVSPDGKKLYASIPGSPTGTLRVVETATGAEVGNPIVVPEGPWELAISADGRTAYAPSATEVTPINLVTGKAGTPIPFEESIIAHLAITPDQSPTAAFTAPSATAGTPATFSGAASTDPDGSIVYWNWAFGDGGTATGVSVTHTYKAAGSYEAKLSVVDNEGCGEEEVFTGRTAYCSGAAATVHAVTAKSPAPAVVPIAAPSPPTNKFTFGRVIHNRRNGTVRLQVRLRSAGFVLLFGPKVHAVTRKSKGVQSMWLTIHARVQVAKRLKKTLRAPVRFRVTFTPDGGTARTMHSSVTLQRAPRHKR